MFLRRVRVSWLRWSCRRDALGRERWPSGGGLAFEFEVVSGGVADEHRVVVRRVLRPQPRLGGVPGAGGGAEVAKSRTSRTVASSSTLSARWVWRPPGSVAREKNSWAGWPGRAYPIRFGISKVRVPPARLTIWSYQSPMAFRSSTWRTTWSSSVMGALQTYCGLALRLPPPAAPRQARWRPAGAGW